MQSTTFLLLADLVLFSHILVVLFVVFGLLAVVVGGILGWSWVRNRTFRGLHLLAIAVVVTQAWLGVVCPLTTLEMYFRRMAGEATYAGSFIAHWMSALLYYQAPGWVFAIIYTAFGMAVLASWFLVKPRGTF